MGTESGDSGTSDNTENDMFDRLNRMGIGARKMMKESLRIQHYTLQNRVPSAMTKSVSNHSVPGQNMVWTTSEGYQALSKLETPVKDKEED